MKRRVGDVQDDGRSRIVLIDAPDQFPDEFIENPATGEKVAVSWERESQRTYRIARYSLGGGLGAPEVVRVRRDTDRVATYVIENLIGKKWHRLLEGSCDHENQVPFDAAVERAVAVLLS